MFIMYMFEKIRKLMSTIPKIRWKFSVDFLNCFLYHQRHTSLCVLCLLMCSDLTAARS